MYKFTDNVIARVAQVIQEGMLLGVDVVDLMRQIEVEPVGPAELELTKEYAQRVADHHEILLKKLEEMQASGDLAIKDEDWDV